jgi:hypothetical protein
LEARLRNIALSMTSYPVATGSDGYSVVLYRIDEVLLCHALALSRAGLGSHKSKPVHEIDSRAELDQFTLKVVSQAVDFDTKPH